MEVRLENTASATTNNDPAHCFVAIELSKSSWVLGFQTPLAKQTSRYQVKACDVKALLELIERVRSRMARELGRPVEVMSCYEAGYDGFWLHRVLEAHGIHNHVLDPASLQVNRRARRPKTDAGARGKANATASLDGPLRAARQLKRRPGRRNGL